MHSLCYMCYCAVVVVSIGLELVEIRVNICCSILSILLMDACILLIFLTLWFCQVCALSVDSECWVSDDFGAQHATWTMIVQWYSSAMCGD